MKKIIVPIILSFILFTGCGEKLNNTPTQYKKEFPFSPFFFKIF